MKQPLLEARVSNNTNTNKNRIFFNSIHSCSVSDPDSLNLDPAPAVLVNPDPASDPGLRKPTKMQEKFYFFRFF
jgi:hypothetical protein